MLVLINAWMKGPEHTSGANLHVDPAEVERLRAELARERKEHEALRELHAQVVKHRNEMRETLEGLHVEVQALKKENQSLRVQAAAAALSAEEARLLQEIGDALGVPTDRGLPGVLERVRANLASVGVLARPIVHEPGGDLQKDVGDVGGPKNRATK